MRGILIDLLIYVAIIVFAILVTGIGIYALDWTSWWIGKLLPWPVWPPK